MLIRKRNKSQNFLLFQDPCQAAARPDRHRCGCLRVQGTKIASAWGAAVAQR
jgi:hypothetical protein